MRPLSVLSVSLSVLSVLSVCNVGVLWPNGWMDQDESWHIGRPLPGHIVLDGDPSPPLQRGTAPQFSAHICCGQIARWVKVPRDMEVGLGPGDFGVRWGHSSPPQKGAEPAIFDGCLLWPNGWMDQDGTWHGGGPWSRPHCARWGPSSPPQKGGRAPQFSAGFYCGQRAGCVKMPFGMQVGLSPDDFVLDGDPVPPPQQVK